MKILVITDVLWRNDNGVGNSYSNIFSGMTDIEVANICCQEGVSENEISTICYQMSESRLILNLQNRDIPTGIVEDITKDTQRKSTGKDKKDFIFRIIKRSRLQVFLWGRNLIWKIGNWKTDALKEFIDSFGPDLIFAQLQDKIYLNNIVRFVQGYTKCPLILYVWDDVYSLKHFSLSPLFWIDRAMQRFSIRRVVKKCSKLYTISVEQKQEYGKTLHVDTGLLYKGKFFVGDRKTADIKMEERVLKFLYTGNLYSGRYETILKLCKKIEQCNQNGLKAQLYIYSGTDLAESKRKKLNIGNSSFFQGCVSEKKVAELQNLADVLVHIEPLSLKGSLLCRLSFSTKLVDYFYNGKCIFAIGSERCASIKYLKRNDAAIVASSIQEAEKKVDELLSDITLVQEYGNKAWRCGYQNHQIRDIQNGLRSDFKRILKSESSSN